MGDGAKQREARGTQGQSDGAGERGEGRQGGGEEGKGGGGGEGRGGEERGGGRGSEALYNL